MCASLNEPGSDDVDLAAGSAPRESGAVEAADVDNRLNSEVDVAHDLPDRRPLEKPMSGEAAGVEEAGDAGRFTEQGVVIGSHLVHAHPTVGDAQVEQCRRSTVHRIHEVRQPVLAVPPLEAGLLLLEGHAQEDRGASRWK